METHARVRIVPDHVLGTNDSRGWVSQSLFDKLNIDPGALYQFRLAFELAQAKGTFKVMPDEVAQHPEINADIVIPESAIKPSRQDLIGRVIEGPAVLGVRDVSRTDTRTKGSYTVLQHASWPVIEEEVIGQCWREIEILKNGFDTEEHRELLEQVGSANSDTDTTGSLKPASLQTGMARCRVTHIFTGALSSCLHSGRTKCSLAAA